MPLTLTTRQTHFQGFKLQWADALSPLERPLTNHICNGTADCVTIFRLAITRCPHKDRRMA